METEISSGKEVATEHYSKK